VGCGTMEVLHKPWYHSVYDADDFATFRGDIWPLGFQEVGESHGEGNFCMSYPHLLA